jgi:hypothetical protein
MLNELYVDAATSQCAYLSIKSMIRDVSSVTMATSTGVESKSSFPQREGECYRAAGGESLVICDFAKQR